MEFADHDVKGLMAKMDRRFTISEVKTLMYQLLSATAYLHENWIIHRYIPTPSLSFFYFFIISSVLIKLIQGPEDFKFIVQ